MYYVGDGTHYKLKIKGAKTVNVNPDYLKGLGINLKHFTVKDNLIFRKSPRFGVIVDKVTKVFKPFGDPKRIFNISDGCRTGETIPYNFSQVQTVQNLK